MKIEPSPFIKKHEVPKKDLIILSQTHPELVDLLSLVNTEVEDPLLAFMKTFNSMSEDERTMVYMWAEQKRARRMEIKQYREQIEQQNEITKIQQELSIRNEVELQKHRMELEKKYGLMQQPNPLNPYQPSYNPSYEPEEKPSGFFGYLRYKYRKWREKKKRQKEKQQEDELLNQLLMAQQQPSKKNKSQQKQQQQYSPTPAHPSQQQKRT